MAEATSEKLEMRIDNFSQEVKQGLSDEVIRLNCLGLAANALGSWGNVPQVLFGLADQLVEYVKEGTK